MKILRVGDPHITVRNIEESERLLDFINKIAVEQSVDAIELLGDLMHTHAVVRIEVQDFWIRSFREQLASWPIIALVGNHDQPGSTEKEQKMNALNVFSRDGIRIVSYPRILNKNIG